MPSSQSLKSYIITTLSQHHPPIRWSSASSSPALECFVFVKLVAKMMIGNLNDKHLLKTLFTAWLHSNTLQAESINTSLAPFHSYQTKWYLWTSHKNKASCISVCQTVGVKAKVCPFWINSNICIFAECSNIEVAKFFWKGFSILRKKSCLEILNC